MQTYDLTGGKGNAQTFSNAFYALYEQGLTGAMATPKNKQMVQAALTPEMQKMTLDAGKKISRNGNTVVSQDTAQTLDNQQEEGITNSQGGGIMDADGNVAHQAAEDAGYQANNPVKYGGHG